MAATLVFTAAIFVGSFLLFLVQPMVGEMLLPLHGGVPAVWNTSLVFFQAALLAGYGYAHLSTRWLGPRRQAALHLALLGVAIAAGAWLVRGPAAEQSTLPPAIAVLGQLAMLVGLPFLAVSAGAPLLQRWFAGTGHPRASDPYFLYAASNLGSLLALLAYPLLVEPTLGLKDQARIWWICLGVLAALLAASAAFLWTSRAREYPADDSPTAEPTTTRTRVEWTLLAAIPSSLLLGVTTFLTTNVAAVPLLWVVPLAIYLLTYVAAFRSRPLIGSALLSRIVALAMPAMAILLSLGSTDPIWMSASIHLLFFLVAGLYCHTRLAESRPEAGSLTEFYFYLSLGGVLGGAFNALVAPLLFETVLEYPIALVALLLLRRGQPNEGPATRFDLAFAVGVGLLSLSMVFLPTYLGIPHGSTRTAVTLGIPVLAAFLAVDRRVRFALSVGAFLLVQAFFNSSLLGRVVFVERSFFGVHRIVDTGKFHELLHGNTVHGRQSLNPDQANVPLTYYHPTGPIGRLFEELNRSGGLKDVGLVGLGVGSLAAYGHPHQTFTFFEIDPVVESIARDERYVTFLKLCRAKYGVVLGDARLSLEKWDDSTLDLLVLDAFSSDAIPTHLITREAVALYMEKLRPNGLLAFHISNRYLDLSAPLARIARDLGLEARIWNDAPVPEDLEDQGKAPSQWVVIAKSEFALEPIRRDAVWLALEDSSGAAAWTDDYSNVVGAFDLGE